MTDRFDITLRQAEGPKQNPDELLSQLVEELGDLAKAASSSGRQWLRAKADQESIKVKETIARIMEGVAKLELQRQKQNLDFDLEQQRIMNAHHEKLQQLKLDQSREQRQSLLDAVQIIKDLNEMDVELDLRVIRKPLQMLIDTIANASVARKRLLEEDTQIR